MEGWATCSDHWQSRGLRSALMPVSASLPAVAPLIHPHPHLPAGRSVWLALPFQRDLITCIVACTPLVGRPHLDLNCRFGMGRPKAKGV